MTRAEAEAVRAEGYRVRVVVYLEHGRHGVSLPASTLGQTPEEVSQAAAALVALLMPRLLAELAGEAAPQETEEE